MDNFKEIAYQRISSSIVIRDLDSDKIILSKQIKNIIPVKKESIDE